jgi:hypothetical protein
MEDTALTLEEKNCLRLWFRQAIAQVEIEEAKTSLLKFYAPEHSATHRISPVRKRSARSVQPVHAKELAY